MMEWSALHSVADFDAFAVWLPLKVDECQVVQDCHLQKNRMEG